MKAPNTTCKFPVTDFNDVKNKMLNWVNRFSIFCFLDNHQYQIPPHSVECLLAAGIKRKISLTAGNALEGLHEFIDEKSCWLFGHLGYDLKNEIENLSSAHPDNIGFPDLFFFEPAIVLRLSENELQIESVEDPGIIYNEILEADGGISEGGSINASINQRLKRKQYLEIIERIKQHILRGDCYELNYCQEFFSENAHIDPIRKYVKLSRISPNPFSALYKLEDKYLLCASPERYLRKQGNSILSQPIKGTSSRFPENEREDETSKQELFNSEKDRSENVMVVDLVRNDLSKVCIEGTVNVEELYGIYSFPQVHQMISTVSGRLKDDIHFTDIIRATFPMGSMTGAPKKKVMELIEKYEKTKRGIFSGALGYIDPTSNFDFNVVIRSIMYNASRGYVSFQAGSGITFYSDAEKEYDECLLKAQAMMKVLE